VQSCASIGVAPFAQLGVGLHQGEQLFSIELDDLAWLADAQSGHRPPSAEQARLAGELPGPDCRVERLSTIGRTSRVDSPAGDEKKTG
jgi:hypothetical protein